MNRIDTQLAGLRTVLVGDLAHARQLVLLLHGYTMQPDDLAPFTQTLRVGHTAYALPQAPLAAAQGGHSWWAIDEAARQRQLEQGPRDLAESSPSGLPDARRRIELLLAELRPRAPHARLVLGGFSQGGMLACDVALHTAEPVSALFALSASRLDFARWTPLLHQDGHQGDHPRDRLRGLPVLVAHGRDDPNLSLAAGERLRDAWAAAGAQVHWVPFDGGHQIPLTVWRQLRTFLQAQVPEVAPAEQVRPPRNKGPACDQP